MKEVFEGLYNLYDAHSNLKGSLTGGFFPGNAPSNASMQYGVYNIVDNQIDPWWDGDSYEQIDLQISIFSDEENAEEICAAFTYVKDCFDDADIVCTGYTKLIFERTGARLVRDFDDTQGSYWMYVVEYRLLLKKD